MMRIYYVPYTTSPGKVRVASVVIVTEQSLHTYLGNDKGVTVQVLVSLSREQRTVNNDIPI